jgi:hypothetical protein
MSDFSPYTKVNMDSSGVGTVEYNGGPQGQLAIFYKRPCVDAKASAEAGRTIKRDQTYVRIAPPGERLNIIDRPATRQDMMIWARQYAQFEQNQEQRPDGTPVELLHPDQPSIGQNLRAFGIHTVEQLAVLSANAIESIGMGGQQYVNDAQAYIKSAESGAGVVQMRRQLEGLERDKRALEMKLDNAVTEIERLKNLNGANGSQPSGLTMADVQAMIASAQLRPEMPRADMPVHKNFDATSAQIAANHPTKIISEAAKPKRKRESF